MTSVSKSFDPRSRVGSDHAHAEDAPAIAVSIRAPVWGATTVSTISGAASVVSIRAPVWGATRDPCAA